MRSETSILTISDGDVNGKVGKSTVNFGLQVKNGKGNGSKQFRKKLLPIFIYFDALADGEGGGCSEVEGGSFSTVSHGHTLQAVPEDSKVVSRCFGGSLKTKNK